MNDFEEFCINHYGSLKVILSSEAKFEIWAYSRGQLGREHLIEVNGE